MIRFSRPKCFHEPLLDRVFIRTAIAHAIADLLKCGGHDLVDGIARFKVTLDLIVGPRRFELADQVAGTDHFFAEAAHYFDGAGVHQRE